VYRVKNLKKRPRPNKGMYSNREKERERERERLISVPNVVTGLPTIKIVSIVTDFQYRPLFENRNEDGCFVRNISRSLQVMFPALV
jgi:hypothetical protein